MSGNYTENGTLTHESPQSYGTASLGDLEESYGFGIFLTSILLLRLANTSTICY
jgi:hypothetical protein